MKNTAIFVPWDFYFGFLFFVKADIGTRMTWKDRIDLSAPIRFFRVIRVPIQRLQKTSQFAQGKKIISPHPIK
jgi:hypothetical protein